MNYITILFLSIVALLLIYTGLRLFNAIHGNFQTAAALRNQYAQRIRLLPTFKMLRLRKIELNELLHRLPVAEIEKGIRTCESCDRNNACQKALKQKNHDDFSFCLNDAMFIKINAAS